MTTSVSYQRNYAGTHSGLLGETRHCVHSPSSSSWDESQYSTDSAYQESPSNRNQTEIEALALTRNMLAEFGYTDVSEQVLQHLYSEALNMVRQSQREEKPTYTNTNELSQSGHHNERTTTNSSHPHHATDTWHAAQQHSQLAGTDTSLTDSSVVISEVSDSDGYSPQEKEIMYQQLSQERANTYTNGQPSSSAHPHTSGSTHARSSRHRHQADTQADPQPPMQTHSRRVRAPHTTTLAPTDTTARQHEKDLRVTRKATEENIGGSQLTPTPTRATPPPPTTTTTTSNAPTGSVSVRSQSRSSSSSPAAKKQNSQSTPPQTRREIGTSPLSYGCSDNTSEFDQMGTEYSGAEVPSSAYLLPTKASQSASSRRRSRTATSRSSTSSSWCSRSDCSCSCCSGTCSEMSSSFRGSITGLSEDCYSPQMAWACRKIASQRGNVLYPPDIFKTTKKKINRQNDPVTKHARMKEVWGQDKFLHGQKYGRQSLRWAQRREMMQEQPLERFTA
eukprot:TRINITY_DN67471_c3_g9_i1.p1 TRINITY_DN67471_c3_g9~~TRINITY_DN67471_c3_g9_i1.p1  ORF type:complete len:505 (-),score=7.18 TRINITY_DN67471_c3_g9_i1:1002-2516(-)